MKLVIISIILGLAGIEIALRFDLNKLSYVFAVVGVLIPSLWVIIKNALNELKSEKANDKKG